MSENLNSGSKPQKNLRALPIVIVICIAAVIVVIVLAKMFTSQSETEAQANIGVEANIVTNDDQAADTGENVAGSFTTYYERDIYVKNGHEATGMIGNDASNPYEDMYIQIFLNEEGSDEFGEEIYLSQIIPRGSHIEQFDLEQDLEPGDYEATLVHACLNEEGELVNNVSVIVEIHVGE